MGMRRMRLFVIVFTLFVGLTVLVFPVLLGQRIQHQLQERLSTFPFPDAVTVNVARYQRHWLYSTFDLNISTKSPLTLAFLRPYIDPKANTATLQVSFKIQHGLHALTPGKDGYLRMGSLHSNKMVLNGHPWQAQFNGRYGWKYIDWALLLPEGVSNQVHLTDWQVTGRYDPMQRAWSQRMHFPHIAWQQGPSQVKATNLSLDSEYMLQPRGFEWLKHFSLACENLQVTGPQTLELQGLQWSQQHQREPQAPWMRADAEIRFDKLMFSDENMGPLDTKISAEHLSIDAIHGLTSMYPAPLHADSRIQTHWEYHISKLFEPQPELNIDRLSLAIPEGKLSATLKSKISAPSSPEAIWAWENWAPRAYVQLDAHLPRAFVLNLVKEMQRTQLVGEIQSQKLSVNPEKFEETIAGRSDAFLKQLEVSNLIAADGEKFYRLSATLLGGTLNLNNHPVFSLAPVAIPPIEAATKAK